MKNDHVNTPGTIEKNYGFHKSPKYNVFLVISVSLCVVLAIVSQSHYVEGTIAFKSSLTDIKIARKINRIKQLITRSI